MTDKEYQKRDDINKAILLFDGNHIYKSATHLLNTLGYYSTKTDRISSPTYEEFINSFNISSNSLNKEKALVSQWKEIEFIFQIADSEITRIQSLFENAKYDSNEYQSFLFFAIKLKEDNYKRSELVKITREINQPFKMPVILLFHYGNKLTFSIIDRRLHKRDTSKDVLEKVTLIKDINISKPQRAHIEILYDLSIDNLYYQFEFHNFTQLHEAWKKTLNISELNRNFYRELAYWYFWAISEVQYPDDEIKDIEVRNPVNVIRLITRLIFVWFLKEKNLVPDELFNKREVDKILDYKDKTGSTYYKAILQNLFFATLNTEMNKDINNNEKISRTFVKRNTGVPHYFRYTRYIKEQEIFQELMNNIPFLNGGLFECLDKRFRDETKNVFIDGFTQQLKNELILKVPDYLFFSDSKDIDLNKTFHTKGKKYKVRGLIDILSSYKFTIEENTPVEEEVALDPELLGKVFENLLASYVEETQTTARKLTGSFYTPREIVNYMVDESLKIFIKNKILEKINIDNLDEKLEQLFNYTDEKHKFGSEETLKLIEIIDSSKILDPACGSGAYPMGILHKLVFILGKLDPNNKLWKLKQLDKAKRDKLLAEKMEDEKNREITLKEIDKRIIDIEKAFDTNNHELDFARKLYLIENCIYGIDKQPIAIQIAKLRFFIALIVEQKISGSLNEYNRGIRPLPNLETKFVSADTLVGIENPEQKSLRNLEIEKEIDEKELELKKIREKHFRARTPETKEKYRIEDERIRKELALLLQKEGFPKDTTLKLANWNPYDQNKSADFFDKEWMFNLENGFDIIIGNPPYIEQRKLKKFREIFQRQYTVYSGMADIFVYFYEKAIMLLNNNGVLCYITSNKFIKTGYGEKLREFLTKRKIEQIIDFSEVHVFEALVSSCIYLSTEKEPGGNIIVSYANDKLLNFENLKYFISQNYILVDQASLGKEIWQLENKQYISIKNHIESIGKKIINIPGVYIYRGITTGFNPAYLIDEHIYKNLINDDSKSKDIIKPLLQGRNIKKWFYIYNDEFLIFAHRSYKIESFIAIFKRLKSFKSDLKNRQNVIRDGELWWQIPYSIAYKNEFETEKIIWGLTADKWAFAYDDKRHYLPSNGYILTSKLLPLKYILGILNSKLMHFYFGFIGIMTAGGAFTLKHETIRELPIKVDNEKEQELIIKLTDYILYIVNQKDDIIVNVKNDILISNFEQVLNGCVFELYFGEEMKKEGVGIFDLIENDLLSVDKKNKDISIEILYNKWKESKNEVRNNLSLMSIRCPETIGIIENNIS